MENLVKQIKDIKYGERFYWNNAQYIKVNAKILLTDKDNCAAVNLTNGNLALFRNDVEIKTALGSEESGYCFEVGV